MMMSKIEKPRSWVHRDGTAWLGRKHTEEMMLSSAMVSAAPRTAPEEKTVCSEQHDNDHGSYVIPNGHRY